MFFESFGPFQITRTDGKIAATQRDLWDAVNERCEGLSRAIGCYAFCLGKGETLRPWYVGQTTAQTGFFGECFQVHKLDHYNEALHRTKRGWPALLLFPLMTGDAAAPGRPSAAHSTSRRTIDWLEKVLIGMALERNPALQNWKDTLLPSNVTVRGVLGSARVGRSFQGGRAARYAFYGD